MGVEPPPPDHIAAGARQGHVAAPRQQRAGQQDAGADFAGQRDIRLGIADASRVQRPAMLTAPFYTHAQALKQRDLGDDIANDRYIVQHNFRVGQQYSRQRGQRGVLVAGRDDGAAELATTLDDEAFQMSSWDA